MQHILTLSRTAVIVRHWFEIDLADASMEHGSRIELRELAAHPRRGSEIEYLRRPDLLDEERVAPWRGTGGQDAAPAEQETAPSGARDGAPSGS